VPVVPDGSLGWAMAPAAGGGSEGPSLAAVPGRVPGHYSDVSIGANGTAPDEPGMYRGGTGKTHRLLPGLPLRPEAAGSPRPPRRRRERRARRGTFGTPRNQREG